MSPVPAVGSSPPDRGEEASERITGRKARGLQMEEIGCKCQTFFSLSLKHLEETNYKCQIFFLSPYKIKSRFLYGNVFPKLC